MAEHALLSASGADRWINCPPSARLEEAMDDETSEYAREGSFAHSLAETYLAYHLGQIKKSEYNKRLKKLKQDPFYSQELDDYVRVYTDFAIEKINEARARTADAVVLLEMKLDYSEWVPGGFGTGDLVLVSDDVLEVIDMKFGRGIAVSAIDNSQMQLYSLGALNQFGCLYNINTVRMTIVQPRLDSISTAEMTVDDLLYWATNTVMGAAEKAYKGEGEFLPGDHCRFCRVRATCRARAEENTKLACYDFREPPLLTDEEIVEVLDAADEYMRWISDVQGYALDQAINNGKQWQGYKLVEGRSIRKYVDETKVAEALQAAGYSEDQIFERVLLGITKMEKAVGKKQFNEVLSGLVEKPPGKVKLAPESDKRPAVRNAAEIDFKEEI
jgi:hydrogenase maturation factor